MTDATDTPMIDRAADEELTSSEIAEALRELGRLDGSTIPTIQFRPGVLDYAVVEFANQRRTYHAECVEDALIQAAGSLKARIERESARG
jgi:hypothetical protein